MPTIARTLAGVITVSLVGAAPAAAEPFTVGPSEGARLVPDLAVDGAGTAHVVYQESRTAIRYCRIPRGARACASERRFDVPSDFEQAVGPQVALGDANRVFVVMHGDDADLTSFRIVTLAAVSNDGGATFAAPAELGAGRAEDVVFGPGNSLTGPSAPPPENPESSDAVYHDHPLGGGGGSAAIGPRGPEPHQTVTGMHVAIAGGAPVFAWNKLITGREPGNASEVWAARWGGVGSIRDGSTWSAPIRVAGGIHNSVAGGPSGAFVTYSRPNDEGDLDGASGIYSTKLEGTTIAQEVLAVPYALRDAGLQAVNSTFGGTTQDPSGRMTTAWVLNDRRVRRGRARPTNSAVVSTATSPTGARWTRTAIACETGPISSPRAATAADGGGFAVYQQATGSRSSEVRAVPIGPGEPTPTCGVEPDGRVYNEFGSSRVLITRGRFAITIGCADGHVRCKATGRLEASGRTIGSRGYSLEPAGSRPWAFRLNRAGRAALARRGRLRVRAVFPTRGARATTITLTLVENRGRATR